MSERILMVDDEAAILQAMASYFRGLGYEVDCARAREEAEGLLHDRRYACLIADLRLRAGHGSEGLELVAFARERWPETRLVVLTAYGSPAAENEARRLGADAFLHKPQPLPEVARVVAEATGRGRPGRADGGKE